MSRSMQSVSRTQNCRVWPWSIGRSSNFSCRIATYTKSYFLTARLAARRMVEKRSGVIMTVTSIPSRTAIPVGGEALLRQWGTVEALTPKSIRRTRTSRHSRGWSATAGMPEWGPIKEVFGLHAKAWGISWGWIEEITMGRTNTRRLSTLAEMANTAAFMASDRGKRDHRNYRQFEHRSLDD